MAPLTERLRCFICGLDTQDAIDYVVVELTNEYSVARQFFGAHAACLNSVTADGFTVEIQLM
ncbi:hypothetical protein SAMN05444157_2816 [Frankineae bacterium MT45]|nr:hypothetical protein SAMN05444157_2816 [Frankineae bacterium MT45]